MSTFNPVPGSITRHQVGQGAVIEPHYVQLMRKNKVIPLDERQWMNQPESPESPTYAMLGVP